jgi:hypothetical protein
MQDGMSAHLAVFLTAGMTLESSVWEDKQRGALSIEAGFAGARLNVHGTANEFRQVAEALHRLADDVERGAKRQRALDNAPRRRTKFTAEPVSGKEEMEIAA